MVERFEVLDYFRRLTPVDAHVARALAASALLVLRSKYDVHPGPYIAIDRLLVRTSPKNSAADGE